MFTDEFAKIVGQKNLDFTLPRVIILGKNFVIIEGHRGVVFFSRTEVKFRLKNTVISISGENLEVKNLTSSNAQILGDIVSLSYA